MRGIDKIGPSDHHERTMINGRPALAFVIDGEVDTLLADPRKAKAELGWTARTSFRALIELMVEADLEHQERITGAKRDRGKAR